MRRLVLLLLVLATAPARADGFYFTESYGGVDVKDDMSAYMDNALHIRLALGMRKRNWALEGWFAGALNFETQYQYGTASGRDVAARTTGGGGIDGSYGDGLYPGPANLAMYGLDLKFLQPVSPHVEVYLRGRMSKAFADRSLDDYAGRGLGVGAGIQLKGKVAAVGLLFWPLFFTNIGPKITGALWVDSSYEFYRLHAPASRSIDAQLSTLSLGFALGSDF